MITATAVECVSRDTPSVVLKGSDTTTRRTKLVCHLQCTTKVDLAKSRFDP